MLFKIARTRSQELVEMPLRLYSGQIHPQLAVKFSRFCSYSDWQQSNEFPIAG
jgi:hypothetical protein